MQKGQEEPNKPTIERLATHWSWMADQVYSEIDSAPQTTYFSLINILQLQSAKGILEVACGRYLLVPYSLQLKNS